MADRKRLVVVGAGGFAREVRWLVDEIDVDRRRFEFAGYVVSDRSKMGPHDDESNVVGTIDDLADGTLAAHAAAIGIGDPGVRRDVGEELSSRCPDVELPSLVHPSVVFDHASVTLGRGSLICAGTMLTVNIDLGDFAMINLGCSVGHEASLGRGAVVNPLVAISGGVRIGDGVLIGTGASILQYLEVGDDATVGAGAVVTKDVAAGSTVIGVPARQLGS